MVTLRLARAGSKKRPVFHLVATDKRSRRDGRFIEKLGYFIPQRDVLVLDRDRIDYWIGVGAEISPTAKSLLKRKAEAPAGAAEAPAPAAPAAAPEAAAPASA